MKGRFQILRNLTLVTALLENILHLDLERVEDIEELRYLIAMGCREKVRSVPEALNLVLFAKTIGQQVIRNSVLRRDARQSGEVPASKLKELILEAEKHWYGDGLDPELLDPWFWASKLHFYITGVTFYNFPYAFGYLLSQGLIARFRKEGASFLPAYEDFLRYSASDTAEGVARHALGIDLGRREFWQDAVDCALAELDDLNRHA